MPAIEIDTATTALVLIDLQKGIVGGQTAPRQASDVVATAARLAAACRAAGVLVILVRVDPGANGALMPRPKADVQRAPLSGTGGFADIVPELGPESGDIVVTKHQHNAFYCTDLEVQLRRRGMRTMILGGISTNVGVEATARAAFERGYEQIFVEDAMAAREDDLHSSSVTKFFPTIGRVRSCAEVLTALGT